MHLINQYTSSAGKPPTTHDNARVSVGVQRRREVALTNTTDTGVVVSTATNATDAAEAAGKKGDAPQLPTRATTAPTKRWAAYRMKHTAGLGIVGWRHCGKWGIM